MRQIHQYKNINEKKGNQFKLTRYDEKTAKIDILNGTIKLLEDCINLDITSNKFKELIKEILNFQDKDGSFKLLSTSYAVPSDAKVDFCYYPTCLCTALLIKSYLSDEKSVNIVKLNQALESCSYTNLLGHGYEALRWQINILKIFIKCGLKDFMIIFPNKNCNFNKMIYSILKLYEFKFITNNFSYFWNEDYKKDIEYIINSLYYNK